MKHLFSFFVLFFSIVKTDLTLASASTWPQGRPKLVVAIVIDQFRADYLSRFNKDFKSNGFKALLDTGAYFPYGEYDLLQAMTGPGHATVLTGAYPYQMGIPLNVWYNPNSSDFSEYCVEDSRYSNIGVPVKKRAGTSPKNLVGTTLGDELKNIDLTSKVVTIALKDRAAILMGGKRADLALWFEDEPNRWTTSDYYIKSKKLPDWVEDLNTQSKNKPCELETPCGIQITADAFISAVKNLKLGQGKDPDLIAVSFSSHDYAGHKHGANSEIMKKMTLAEDDAIAQMRETLQKQVPGGLKNVLFVLTGDHGVAPAPGYLENTGIESGKIEDKKIMADIEEVLNKKFGSNKNEKWVNYTVDFNFFLNEDLIKSKKLEASTIEQEVKTYLLTLPMFAHVFTREDYKQNKLPPGVFERQIKKTYYTGRSGHVIGIVKPFYIPAGKNFANHLSSYTYDRMVPILFSGFGVKPGLYPDKAEVVDIAPTLAFMLGVIPPALSEGKVLKQAIAGAGK